MANYITMSSLGRCGRFANQVIQYAFLRVYALQHDLTVQNAPWVGEELFGIRPAPVTVKLPQYAEPHEGGVRPTALPDIRAVNRDFSGWAQYHTSFYRPHKKFLQGLFRPVIEIRQRMDMAVRRLGFQGRTRVGVHLRRGDYGQREFYITPVDWYLNWLDVNWMDLNDPVLFVASEDKSLVDEFADYDPQTTESLGVDLEAKPLRTYNYLARDLETREPHLLDFVPDWYLLTQCEYVLMPNSTFSFAAAMMSRRLQHAFRSDLPTQRFKEIDVWDTTPMTYELAEDFRHVPGVCLAENPHW